jgi:hypothetical protein
MIAWVIFISVLGFLTTSVIFFSLILVLFERRKRKIWMKMPCPHSG